MVRKLIKEHLPEGADDLGLSGVRVEGFEDLLVSDLAVSSLGDWSGFHVEYVCIFF